jgi:hypothetical protein
MKFIRNILAVSPFLNIALVIAIGSVVVMEAYLFEIPEIVPWGEEFGAVFYKLCLSIMASYLFYFIVVHLKSQSDKENINAFVASKSYRVVGEYKSQIVSIKKEANSTIESEYPSKDELEAMFSLIHPKGNAPLMLGQFGGNANWMQYMSYHNKRTQELIKKVFVKMPFLDSKLVRLLAEIDDSTHFSVIETTISFQFNNADMSAWAGSFYDYSVLCKELEEYNEKKLSKYKP